MRLRRRIAAIPVGSLASHPALGVRARSNIESSSCIISPSLLELRRADPGVLGVRGVRGECSELPRIPMLTTTPSPPLPPSPPPLPLLPWPKAAEWAERAAWLTGVKAGLKRGGAEMGDLQDRDESPGSDADLGATADLDLAATADFDAAVDAAAAAAAWRCW